LSLLLLILSLLPLLSHQIWWVRGLDFPRLQILCALLAVAGVQVILGPHAGLGTWTNYLVLGSAIALQSWWIIPYTRLYPLEVPWSKDNSEGNPRISILSANVLTPNHNAKALLELVRSHSPDILLTLESDTWWERHLDTLLPEYPYAVKCPLDNLYGIHVYSRVPLIKPQIAYLVEDDIPSIHCGIKLDQDTTIQLHALHPAPPSPTQNKTSSERDAELIAVAKRVRHNRGPAIVAGDLNDVAWSETTRLFRKISGMLDPRIGRGMFNTYNAKKRLVRWPLDHLFHSPHFTLHSIRRLPYFGSDHFALYACLEYAPHSRGNHGLSPDQDDFARAQDKMDKHNMCSADVPAQTHHRVEEK
jgi:endonuclease/exonuclease/phosphatase (EEP) superfamily protein YafD